jgi:hypothetical protein
MLCEHRRTSFLCFMFRIPMLHSVRLLASGHLICCNYFMTTFEKICSTLAYGPRSHGSPHELALRVSHHSLFFIYFYFTKLFSLIDPRLCGSRSHGSPNELALRISDRSNLIIFIFYFPTICSSSAMRLSLPRVAKRARASNSRDLAFSILRFRFSRSTLRLLFLCSPA